MNRREMIKAAAALAVMPIAPQLKPLKHVVPRQCLESHWRIGDYAVDYAAKFVEPDGKLTYAVAYNGLLNEVGKNTYEMIVNSFAERKATVLHYKSLHDHYSV
jgi:hypothetical protein